MTTEESNRQIHKIIGIIEDCIEIPVDDLVSNPHWGELNFEGARDGLKKAFSTLNKFLKLPIDKLPTDEIQPMIQSLRSLQSTINQIKSFNLNSSHSYDERNRGYVSENDTLERDIIVKNLKRKVDNFHENAQPWISYLVHHKNNIQINIEKLASVAKEAEKMVADAGEIIVATKQASASVGAGEFTRVFFDEAKTLKKSAKKWLRVTGIFGILTLAVASIFLFFLDLDAEDGYTAVQLITARLIILGVLLSATVWCGRVYKALMHQVTINRHRANSIKTFPAFTKAASNDVTRDAILIEATRAIFGSNATGYLDKEAVGSGGDQLKVVEVVKQSPKDPKSRSD